MKKVKTKRRYTYSLFGLMMTLIKELLCLYPRLTVNYKKESTSKIIELVIIHSNLKIDKQSDYKKQDSFNTTDPLVDDWSVIAVNDENGTVSTLPALVLSEEESKNLQQILAKYNL